MKEDWRKEVMRRLDKDDTYRQWKKSLQILREALRSSMTDAQLDLFEDYDSTMEFMGFFGQDYSYELGVEHGLLKAQERN